MWGRPPQTTRQEGMMAHLLPRHSPAERLQWPHWKPGSELEAGLIRPGHAIEGCLLFEKFYSRLEATIDLSPINSLSRLTLLPNSAEFFLIGKYQTA